MLRSPYVNSCFLVLSISEFHSHGFFRNREKKSEERSSLLNSSEKKNEHRNVAIDPRKAITHLLLPIPAPLFLSYCVLQSMVTPHPVYRFSIILRFVLIKKYFFCDEGMIFPIILDDS